MTLELLGASGSVADSTTTLNDQIKICFATPTYNGTLSGCILQVGDPWRYAEDGRCGIFISSTGELVAQSTTITGSADGGTPWMHEWFGPSSITAGMMYGIALWGDASPKSIPVDEGPTTPPRYLYAITGTIDWSASGNGDFRQLDPLDWSGWSATNADRIMRVIVTYKREDITPSEWTTFNTPIGSATSFVWNSGQFNNDSGMRSTTQDGLGWGWMTITGSTSYYIPRGSETDWSWSAEDA